MDGKLALEGRVFKMGGSRNDGHWCGRGECFLLLLPKGFFKHYLVPLKTGMKINEFLMHEQNKSVQYLNVTGGEQAGDPV